MSTTDNNAYQLLEQVKAVFNEIESITHENVSEWVEQQLNIESVTHDPNGNWLGAEVLAAFGGPDIRVFTRYKVIEGNWGGDSISYPFHSPVLDEYLEELYS